MPTGVPVATVALDGARNAGILAAQIVGTYETSVAKKLDAFKRSLKSKVESSAKVIEKKGWRNTGS
jgi:5-(carboxyamino)imidazole ribonucleotide mutase